MNKQKYIWIILISIFILSFVYFLYQRYIPEKSNITEKQTQQTMESIENQYNTKEMIIVFKEGVSKKEATNEISDFDGEIVEYLPEIQNYRVKINKEMRTEELLYLMEELNQRDTISLAVLNEKVKSKQDTDSDFNTNKIENNKVFDNALAIYNKPANVYYSENGFYTFLYPSYWDSTEEGKLVDIEANKQMTYILKKSKVDLFEDVIKDTINKEEKLGLTLDSEMDQYEQDKLIISKWVMKKDDTLQPRALIQGDDFYYYFQTNEKVSLDEFSLVVDSFIVNKNPLKK
ncbi:hypothetical protein MZM54_04610 [[Brevibacterium] frigoritolerans]|nr:hypothetical protein [Peribacillus frigoritolerans]